MAWPVTIRNECSLNSASRQTGAGHQLGEAERGIRWALPLAAWPQLGPTFLWRPTLRGSLGAWAPCFITYFSPCSPDYPQFWERLISLKLRVGQCNIMMNPSNFRSSAPLEIKGHVRVLVIRF